MVFFFGCCTLVGAVFPLLLAFELNHRSPTTIGDLLAPLICLGPMAVFGSAIVVVSTILVFQSAFWRRVTFDLQLQICRFRNIPGFGCDVPLDSIEAVVLCDARGWGNLCLAVHGWNRVLRIHAIYKKRRDSDAATVEMRAVARQLAQLIDRPLVDRGTVSPFELSYR